MTIPGDDWYKPDESDSSVDDYRPGEYESNAHRQWRTSDVR
jgi:hypothetical protein